MVMPNPHPLNRKIKHNLLIAISNIKSLPLSVVDVLEGIKIPFIVMQPPSLPPSLTWRIKVIRYSWAVVMLQLRRPQMASLWCRICRSVSLASEPPINKPSLTNFPIIMFNRAWPSRVNSQQHFYHNTFSSIDSLSSDKKSKVVF